MKSPLSKVFIVLMIAIGALGVCFLGYRVNASRIRDQKVAYAESAIKANTKTLDQLAEDTAELYTDESKEFFAEGVTLESVQELLSKAGAMQVSAESFSLNEKELPKGAEELAERKKSIVEQLRADTEKMKLQDKVSGVFAGEVNWQTASNDPVIKEDLTLDNLTGIQGEVSERADGPWKTLANGYLTSASQQVERVHDIQQALDSYVKEGKLASSEISQTSYNDLAAQIREVKNQVLQAKLQEQADELQRLITEASPGTAQETASDEGSTSNDYVQEDTSSYGW